MAKFLITNEGRGISLSSLTAFENIEGNHWVFTVDGERYVTAIEEEITAEEVGNVIGSAIHIAGYSITWKNAESRSRK